MSEWYEEVQQGFLKIEEGESIVVLDQDPEQIDSKFGKKQWTFPNAVVNSVRGTLVVSKRAMAAIGNIYEERGKKWPLRLRVLRKGLDLNTKYSFEVLTEQVKL